jgi:hypothetical protein
MRNAVVIALTAFVFLVGLYANTLQDRMRRKAARPGESYFSLGFQLRALATKEAVIFALLALVMAGIVAGVIELDRVGYLGPH